MKKIIVTLMLGFCFSATVFAQDQIIGKWLSPKKDGHIEIFKENNKYFGKIVWGKSGNKKDEKNPDEKLRTRILIGTVIFSGFEYKDGEWINGKIYDPNSGNTYSSKIKLNDDGKVMSVRGFIGLSLFGRTEKFERIN